MRIRIPFKRYLVLLGTYLKPQWKLVALMIVTMLLEIFLQLLNPQILKIFIDTATTNSFSTTLLTIALLYMGTILVKQVASLATSYLSTHVAWTATNGLRRDLAIHCLSLDMDYYKAHTPGEMIERIDGDVDKLSNFFSRFSVNLVSHGLLLIGVLFLFYTITWYVGVTMSLFTIFAFLALAYLRRHSISIWGQDRQMDATFFGFLSERLRGRDDICANGALDYILRRMLLLLRQSFRIHRKAVRMVALTMMGSGFLFACGTVLALALGIYLWSVRAISLGTMYLIYAYITQLSQPIGQLQSELQDLQQAEACIKRVEDLFKTSSTLQEGPGHALPDGALSVSFQHVTFGYVPDDAVLHDLTFQVPPDKVLAIIGRTGSGKTTIARLLFRLYDPQAGEISLEGVPLRCMKLRELRRHIGMVTQDVQIFHASVRDNITFFDSSITDARILTMLEEVGLMTWYQALPNGLDTVLGSDAQGLSAGEAQLLAFTRVFLTNPGLVILDEASSRLDPMTEHLITRAVNKLLAQRTAIIIAHRLTTIQHADNILILEKGHIQEFGSRAALVLTPTSRFSQLLQTGLEGDYA